MQTFPLSAVRLGPGPARDAQDADVRYVLALDPDRLYAPYLREAGLDAPDGYGSWEGDGLDGHIGGHHLSACAQLWAATGDPRLRDRMEAVLDVLQRCQDAVGTGYLGGVPGGRALGEELAAGRVDADTFSLNGRWVPLYNLHKTLAGLIEAATSGGSARALTMATAWADWWLSVSRPLSDDAFEDLLRTEFGGMADAFAELAELTGRDDLLAEAHRFAHREVLDPLADGRDELDGTHANTQIAKVVGYARIAARTGDPRYRTAAESFWRTVTERRTVAFGGNSAREHFHRADDFTEMVTERQGPETCNTHNMLRLTRLLLATADRGVDDAALLDYAERATLNHVLSSQHPERGGFVYFTPIRPAHYRVLSQPETSMWCCVGSGLEGHARYGDVVFGRLGDDLAVNVYLAATLDWVERGLTVRLEADPFTSDTAVLHLTADRPVVTAVHLRVPPWARAVDVTVDDEPVAVVVAGGRAVLRRTWTGHQVVTVRFTTGLAAEALPDGSPWVAFRWGPVVLAARDGAHRLDGLLAGDERMGHVAAGPTRPLAATPVVAAPDPVRAAVLRSRDPLRVDLTVWHDGDDRPGTVTLEPFSAVHDERYTLYWPVGADVAARRAALAETDRAEAAAAAVVDDVVAGEQQPESDHAFAGEATRAARLADGTPARSATGWFSYTLTDPHRAARVLRLTFATAAEDPGARRHAVRLDGRLLGDPTATRVVDGVVHLDHDLPDDVPAAGGEGRRLVVSVHAVDGLPTGDLLRVQLLRRPDDPA